MVFRVMEKTTGRERNETVRPKHIGWNVGSNKRKGPIDKQ